MRNTQVISAIQKKGGCCKSSTLMTIGSWMARDGANVAVIDTDPQKTSYRFCKLSAYDIQYAYIDNHEKMKKAVALFKKKGFDIVLIDTAGNDNVLSRYAANVSDLIIVPAIPDRDNVLNAVETYKYLTKLAAKLKKNLDFRLLISDADKETVLTKAIVNSIQNQKIKMFNTIIGHGVGFREFMSTSIIPKSGSAKTTMESMMCYFQMNKLIEFYNVNDKEVSNG